MKTQTELHFSTLLSHFPARKPDVHKGDFGYVAVVGGNSGMVGAPILAASACFRVGAGIVKVVTRPEHALLPAQLHPEIQSEGVVDVMHLKQILDKATVIIVGPGLGQDAWAKSLLEVILLDYHIPMVVDADALRLLSHAPQVRDNWVLTPHLGEAAALLQTTPLALKTQRHKTVMTLQARYGGVTVLKGHHTLLACPGEKIPSFCSQGNPGMATAGMGDVLSGVIGGLLAQGLNVELASKLGVVLHAKAGDSAAREGERGMIASDLLPYLRKWVN